MPHERTVCGGKLPAFGAAAWGAAAAGAEAAGADDEAEGEPGNKRQKNIESWETVWRNSAFRSELAQNR